MQVKVIAVAIVAVLGASVAAVAMGLFGDRSDAYAYVPRDALALGHVTLDPSLTQKRALQSLSQRLPAEARDAIAAAVPEQLDKLLGEAGLDFEEDVKPWLGDDLVMFGIADGRSMAGGALLATTDGEGAMSALRSAMEREVATVDDAAHREVEYATAEESAAAVLGPYVVVGQTPAVQAAIDASIDGGIDGVARFTELTGTLEPDRLLTYWVDAPALLDHVQVMEDLTEQEREQLATASFAELQQPLAGAVFATPETVVLEHTTRKDPDAEGLLTAVPDDPGLLGATPAAAWFAAVVPDIGTNLQTVLDASSDRRSGLDRQANEQIEAMLGTSLEEVIAWMGDGSFFVGGGSVDQLFGALSISSSDAAATADLVDRTATAARDEGVPVAPLDVAGLRGYELQSPQVPVQVALLGGDRLVLAAAAAGAGPDALTTAVGDGGGFTLADDATYTAATAALGEGVVPLFYMDTARTLDVARSAFGASSTPPQLAEAEPYLDRLAYVVAGTRDDGGRMLQRVVIGTTAE